MVSDVMAAIFQRIVFQNFIHRNAVWEQVVPTTVNTQYSIKGRHKRNTIDLMATSRRRPGSTNNPGNIIMSIKICVRQDIGFLDLFC